MSLPIAGWLPIDTLIRYHTLICVPCVSFIIIKTFNLLDPPKLFGPQNTSTRCPPTFANTERCRLSRSQTFFCHREQSGGMT